VLSNLHGCIGGSRSHFSAAVREGPKDKDINSKQQSYVQIPEDTMKKHCLNIQHRTLIDIISLEITSDYVKTMKSLPFQWSHPLRLSLYHTPSRSRIRFRTLSSSSSKLCSSISLDRLAWIRACSSRSNCISLSAGPDDSEASGDTGLWPP
jgi:hypothetical protein